MLGCRDGISVLWDVTPCSLVAWYHRVGGSCWVRAPCGSRSFRQTVKLYDCTVPHRRRQHYTCNFRLQPHVRSALIWDFIQRRVVIPNRRCGITILRYVKSQRTLNTYWLGGVPFYWHCKCYELCYRHFQYPSEERMQSLPDIIPGVRKSLAPSYLGH